MPRPAGEREDWYFFGYGHDYKQALGDYVRVRDGSRCRRASPSGLGGRAIGPTATRNSTTLSPAFTNTVCRSTYWSSTWTGTSTSSSLWPRARKTSRATISVDGYTWNSVLFPAPKLFLDHLHEEGLKATLNLHPASGVGPWEDALPGDAEAMDNRSDYKEIRALRHHQ